MRAAIFQCAGGGLTSDQRFDALAEIIKGQDLDLVVCPELFLSGYKVGAQVRELAETQSGLFAQKIATLSKKTKTCIIYGYSEIVSDSLYNSALCVDAYGKVLANHRKLAIPPGFERDFFTPGDDFTLFDLGGLKCALLICYDAEFPEAVRAVAQKGAQVVIVPTILGMMMM